MNATLVRIIQHPTDWYEDTRRDKEFVYRTDNGNTESVSEYFVPNDCRTIGNRVELQYKYFTLGNAEGYHYEPRRLSMYEERNEPRAVKIRELYAEYEKKLERLDREA